MANDAIIIQAVSSGSEYISLISQTINRHLEYCRWHLFDYRLEWSDFWHGEEGQYWAKVRLIGDALETHKFVVWLDADAFVLDVRYNLREPLLDNDKPFAACIYTNPHPHVNAGVMYWRSCDMSKQMIRDWLALYPGSGDWQHEQGPLNNLIVNKWGQECFSLADARWNCTDYLNPCKDPVVFATHGYKGIVPRMRKTEKILRAWRHASPVGE